MSHLSCHLLKYFTFYIQTLNNALPHEMEQGSILKPVSKSSTDKEQAIVELAPYHDDEMERVCGPRL